ncbi:MAG TPA: hypothetical protein VL691_13510 [Vicinamibacteria bacterium]|nr:hypothetical protein [Vicinamibacteria bacterium]
MRFGLLGACVALTAFLAATVVGSLWAALLGRLLAPLTARWSGVGQRRLLLALRLLPAALGFLFAGTLVAPAWVDLEPPNTQEHLGLALALLSGLAAALLLEALARGVESCRMSDRLAARWTREGAPMQVHGLDLPAYRIESDFPVVSVVGTRRPRLFIASKVLEVLTPAELGAAVAHEAAHVRGRDNWLRLLLLSCPDVLGRLALGRHLQEAWEHACEAAADERAGAGAALDLASVLVKVARLAQGGAPIAVGSHVCGSSAGIAERVRRLLARAEGHDEPIALGWSSLVAWAALAAVPVALCLLAATDRAQAFVQGVAEILVRLA